MTVYLSNRDGNGKTNEEGHLRLLSNILDGQTLGATGLKVTQHSTPAMSVDVQVGDYRLETAPGEYAYMGWLNAISTVTITTADGSNPRITVIAIYVDKGATTSASPPNNPGIAKLIAVNGTASSSPVAPSSAAIQTAVGAGNPFMVLANVTVPASASVITNSNISDQRVPMTISSDVLSASNLLQAVGPLLYPVGSIYTNANVNTNPATLLGFGTWSQFGNGRVMVGIDTGDTDFGTLGATPGAKTVTLSEAQIPSHTHTIDPPSTGTSTNGSHTHNFDRDVAFTDNSTRRTGPANPQQAYGFGNGFILPSGAHSHTVDIPSFTSGTTGNSQSHTNIQPSVVVYMWRRTA